MTNRSGPYQRAICATSRQRFVRTYGKRSCSTPIHWERPTQTATSDHAVAWREHSTLDHKTGGCVQRPKQRFDDSGGTATIPSVAGLIAIGALTTLALAASYTALVFVVSRGVVRAALLVIGAAAVGLAALVLVRDREQFGLGNPVSLRARAETRRHAEWVAGSGTLGADPNHRSAKRATDRKERAQDEREERIAVGG